MINARKQIYEGIYIALNISVKDINRWIIDHKINFIFPVCSREA